MLNLLRSDFLKQKKSSTLWVCIVLAFLLGIVMAVLYYIVWINIGSSLQAQLTLMNELGIEKESFEEALAQFPEPNLFEYANACLSDTNVLYIGAVVIGVFTASEYSMGTIRNSISRGFSRTQIYFSKLIASSVSMVSIVFAYVLGGAVTSVIMFGFSTDTGNTKMFLILISYLCLYLAASAFYMMISVIMKKTGHAIAVSIVFPILVESVISVITMSNSNLIPLSKFWIFRTFVSTESLCLNGQAYIPMLVAACYFVICTSVGLIVFRRQQVS